MRVLRIIYPKLAKKKLGQKLALRDEQQLRHLQVLRAGSTNYKFEITDGLGLVATAELKQLTKAGALFLLGPVIAGQREQASNDKASGLSIALPLIRLPELEDAIRQIVQLNLYRYIYLYFSDFTRYSEKRISDNKLKRLEKIIESAFIQSRSLLKPQLVQLPDLAAVLAEVPTAQVVAPHFSHEQFSAQKIDPAVQILLVLGAEGGFSAAELEQLNAQKNVYLPQLGDSVLTTGTAALAFSALLKSCVLSASY